MDNKKVIGLVVGVALLVGGAAFFCGVRYANSAASSNRSGMGQFRQGQGPGGARQQMGGANRAGGFVVGEVLSKDDQSFTIRLADQSTKIVYFSTSTTIGRMATGTSADVSVGTSVSVSGTTSDQGVVTAQTIQIRPAGR